MEATRDNSHVDDKLLNDELNRTLRGARSRRDDLDLFVCGSTDRYEVRSSTGSLLHVTITAQICLAPSTE